MFIGSNFKCRVFELYYRKIKTFMTVWCAKWRCSSPFDVWWNSVWPITILFTFITCHFPMKGFTIGSFITFWIKNELFRALFWYSKHLLRKIQLNTQLLDTDTTWWQTFAATWWQKLWLDTLNAFKKPKDIICNEVSFLRIFCN